ncbi:MAG: HAD-IB family phosphatase [Promethearchaeota archaeon]
MNKKESGIICLSAIGLDSTGLVAKITNKVLDLKGNIIDVEENCRRGLFSMFLVIDFSRSERPLDEVTRELKGLEGSTGLQFIISAYDADTTLKYNAKEDHVVTILGVDKRGIIATISTFFMNRNINIETCKMIARGKFFSMEMVIDTSKMTIPENGSKEMAIETMKAELKETCAALNQSVVIQSENIYNKAKKLIVFDVESTLIQDDSIKDFLERIKAKSQPFAESCNDVDQDRDELEILIENAKMLEGIPICEFENLADILQLNPGAIELISILKSMGFKIALLSSGFNFFIKKIFESAGVDYAFSNALQVNEQGLITGKIEEPIITDSTKNEILEFIMNVENITRDQVIAVGDGSTRAHFMKNVGLSLAFKPEEKGVTTDGVLSSGQILNMLYCLGIPKQEIEQALKKNHHRNDA